MNIEATEADLRAAAKVIQLAAILDDRVAQPDKARIAAWAEQIHRNGLALPDLLDGLQAFYDGPSDRSIQIGDLIGHARTVRRDRTEREQAAEQAARLAQRDDRAANDVHTLAAGSPFGPTRRTPRLEAAEAALQCATNRHEAAAAFAEFTAAKIEARKGALK